MYDYFLEPLWYPISATESRKIHNALCIYKLAPLVILYLLLNGSRQRQALESEVGNGSLTGIMSGLFVLLVSPK